MKKFLFPVLLAGLILAPRLPKAHGDEGLWLFTNPPRKLLKERYQFEPTDAWLEHLQKASVRFNNGGSGSFVSPHGLVMTNHHVGRDVIEQLSTEKRNLLKEGFHARTQEEELKAKALELNVLMSIEDVTERVKAAVKPDMSPTQAFEARRAVIAQIEQESQEKTKLRSNVITLYAGGQYHLYRFQRYTDVRLVFAPEQQIAFFGGDPDNFAYPRYNLDVCFFRVYENGKPIKVKHYLKWNRQGAREGELVFVSGHPGRTNRLNTVAELEYLRDVGYPFLLSRLYRWEVLAQVYSAQSEEHERQAKDLLDSVANSRKAREGGLAGLLDPAVMRRKMEEEKALRGAVAKNPPLKDVMGAWDRIAQAQKVRAQFIRRYTVLEAGAGFNTRLFSLARTLVRAADEYPKPNEKRLQEFQESNKKSLELDLFSEEPIYKEFEQTKLTDSLTFLCEHLGFKDKLVQKVLAGKSPRQRAAELIAGTHLEKVSLRKKLYQGGKEAIAASDDPMIALARLVDAESRTVRKTIETQVDEVKRQAYADIARARFAIQGTDTYPDATFTLRLSIGTVKGYEENGKKIPYQTTYAGLYERNREKKNKPPFDLPPRWVERKGKLNLDVPFNFVCTNDIIGGNSGSPVVNRDNEVVGLVFDGNIQSLVWDFVYTDEQARTVAVHSAGIIEALRVMYDAGALADEIVGK